jgi:hypothetical protein
MNLTEEFESYKRLEVEETFLGPYITITGCVVGFRAVGPWPSGTVDQCGKRAEYHRRHYGQYLCGDHYRELKAQLEETP